MPTMLPWTSIEIGELEVFAPATPCLLVHTSYVDGEPESSVTYFWQDATTGVIQHEVLFLKPVGFDEALAWAQEHAATENIERIHVRHARAPQHRGMKAKKARKAGAAAQSTKKKRGPAKQMAGKKLAGKTPAGKKLGGKAKAPKRAGRSAR